MNHWPLPESREFQKFRKRERPAQAEAQLLDGSSRSCRKVKLQLQLQLASFSNAPSWRLRILSTRHPSG